MASVLIGADLEFCSPRWETARLADAGFVAGSVSIEVRWANLNSARLPALAADLVDHQVAVLFAANSKGPLRVAKAATATIPIVFFYSGDPVQDGFAASLNWSRAPRPVLLCQGRLDLDVARAAAVQPIRQRQTMFAVSATHAIQLYAGSLVTAKATARVILGDTVECATLVAMGNDGATRADEDELCAIHLRNLLEGRPGNASAIREVILAGPRIADFHDPSKPHLHSGDLDIAPDIDRYDFAVRITQEEGRPVARAVP